MTSRSKLRALVFTGLSVAAVFSCGGTTAVDSCVGLACEAAPLRAKGTFQGAPGTRISGTVALVQQGSTVQIVGTIFGAPPGAHGFHIHASGDCSAPDFSSAGGHFNPTNTSHACPPTEPRHAGDFGNIMIDSDGVGRIEVTSDRISLAPGPSSVRGLAVILHDHADDCTSQPSGGSGARVACAVIEPE
jgi:Cu-Zn family superoxide dismutase